MDVEEGVKDAGCGMQVSDHLSRAPAHIPAGTKYHDPPDIMVNASLHPGTHSPQRQCWDLTQRFFQTSEVAWQNV